ncbi:M20 family metallopeptidase [Cohnella caldifontis]|uniref:M20 family metallopeptidase n=1 Tax=Cohnella caldifontis TaxID=3027471 RepID=UPI0023ED7C16|nr:M20 family metallopeptidase [Cohnella sp. YIM B05605]
MRYVWEPDEAVALLRDWIRTDTCNPPGNEHRLSPALRAFMGKWGIPARIRDLGGNRSNVEARLPGIGGGRKLMFCGHLDTVAPWKETAGKYPPHGAAVEGGRIYGRGASDMKSGLAAMLLAMASLKRDGIRLGGELSFLATAGEEADSCGARAYTEEAGDLELDALVIGEPTGGNIAAGHKGALWLRIAAIGRSAHASMPEIGRNAVEAMMEATAFLRRLEPEWRVNDPLLGGSSMAFTRIGGGVQTNVIPDRCELEVDIRVVPPLNAQSLFAQLSAKLEKWSRGMDGIRFVMKPLLVRNPVRTPTDDPIFRHALDIQGGEAAEIGAVPYYTDASVMQKNGRPPVLIYGPGEPGQAHQPDEWVGIEAYLQAIGFYRELAIRYLGVSV